MKWVRIDEIAEVNPRGRALPLSSNDLVTFVPMAAVSEMTRTVVAPEVRPYHEVAKGYTYFEEGDVIVAKITPCFENGKIALAEQLPHPIAFGSTEYHVFRAGNNVFNRFLFHLLQAPIVLSNGASQMKGAAGQKRVPADFFKSLEIPLPSLAEQKRIAGILDEADELRTRRRESLAQLDALLRSIFLEMFGDPVTNSKEWELDKIGSLGQVITGNTPSRKHPDYYGDTIEWIKSDNINDPSYILTKAAEFLSKEGMRVARLAPAGSILVTCIAGSPSCIGNSAIADREVAFNQQINAFIPGERLILWYAFGLLMFGKRLVQLASTNSMKGMVSKSAFSNIRIPVPPLKLQAKFAELATTSEALKVHYLTQLTELDTLFASLQSRAFRGEL